MGYESRVYIGIVRRQLDSNTHQIIDKQPPYCERLAIVDLAKMNYDFTKLFTKTIDFDLYQENGNDLVKTDMYDEECKYTDIDTIIKYLKKEIRHTKDNPYRRTIMLYDLLNSFKKNIDNWEFYYGADKDTIYQCELVVVHYGY